MSYRIELVGDITIFNDKDEPFKRVLTIKEARYIPLTEEFADFLGLPKEKKLEPVKEEPKTEPKEEPKEIEPQKDLEPERLTKEEFEQVTKTKVEENPPPKGLIRKE